MPWRNDYLEPKEGCCGHDGALNYGHKLAKWKINFLGYDTLRCEENEAVFFVEPQWVPIMVRNGSYQSESQN